MVAPSLEILEKSGDGDTSAVKHPSTTQLIRVSLYTFNCFPIVHKIACKLIFQKYQAPMVVQIVQDKGRLNRHIFGKIML